MRLWQGISFGKVTVENKGNKKDIAIAMTEDESKDKSYVEYLKESVIEKTQNEMQNKPIILPKKGSREHLTELMKEVSEYRNRKRESPNKKYY
jgi:selenocysteine-specific translation elongation factor